MKRLIIVGMLFLSLPGYSGGGWPQPRRGGYFKLSQNYIGASNFFAPDGSLVEITTIQLFTTSLYGEYGFTDRLTGLIYFPFFVRNTLNEIQYNQSGNTVPGDALQSVGDTDIAIKYGLIVNKPVVVSATLILGLPLGIPAGGTSQILQTGDGEFNQMLKIDASHSFYPKPFYVSAYAAFNNRTNDFSDEVRFGAEVGFTLKKFIPILKLNVVQSLYNGDAEEAQNGIFSNNTEYISPTLELNYQLSEQWGVSGSGGFAFAAKNILAAPNWGIGLYLKL
jgi:protein XagA